MTSEVVKSISNDLAERLRLMSEEKAILDAQSRKYYYKKLGLKLGRKKGLQQGLQQGIEQGLQQGLEKSKKEILELINRGFSIEQLKEQLEFPNLLMLCYSKN